MMRLLPVLALLVACGGTQTTGDSRPSSVTSNTVRLPTAEPVISFSASFAVGSAHDPKGKEGLAWLTGQLISEGATQENSYEAILKKLFPMAASYGALVDREMTTVRGSVHKDHLEAYLSLYTEAFTRPAFLQSDFDRIKADGISYLEKTLRYAQDEELGKAALYTMIFPGTGYAHPVAGTVSGLKAITLDDVKAFYDKHYTAANVRLGIAGGFSPNDLARFEATKSALPRGSAPTTDSITPTAPSGRQVLLVQKKGADASISFGHPITVKRGDKDFYALWVMSSWLGEHRNQSSHLFKVIREKRGLNYGDYAYVEAFPQGGFRQMPPTNVARSQQFFEVWIRTLPNDKAVFALRAALREVTRLVDSGMTQEEFELTRGFLRKYVNQYAPTTSTRLGYAMDDGFYGIDEGHLARTQTALAALTLADVNNAIKRHISVEDLHIAIVTGEAQAMEKALVSGAPSPITYPTKKPSTILEEDKVIESVPLNIVKKAVKTRQVDSMFQ